MEKNEMMRTMSLQEQQEINGGGALDILINLKSATPFPKCYLHKEKWTFDS
ncbi:hypothetical protein Bacsa_3717 (plasmid) [Phocaeicola salanitronis DSM 18170]|uniref:Uncharacterized protein n=1 Tax=Phocaeicola salanitronis (strain DSM 18170 / JCM 13657 / CCUG 60908 / BL78) TaxID=667015 RepID=F0R9B7_PHOSB|nr:hypothetical protein [Phocaeicola salanitronis]ADY38238.1 hypothetical protein Bacsa_3717 [Phocaeicola salanitronis DSM 18170]